MDNIWSFGDTKNFQYYKKQSLGSPQSIFKERSHPHKADDATWSFYILS